MSLLDQAKITDYAWLLWYRRRLFISLALVLFAIGAVITILLPSQYTATATLLFDQPSIDADTTAPQLHTAAEIQTTLTRILTTANLEAIVQKWLPDAQSASSDDIDTLAIKLKKELTVHIDNVDNIDQKTGYAGAATIGFTVSYIDTSKEVARGVVSDVVGLFLHQSATTSTAGDTDAVALLTKQSQQLEARVEVLASGLAKYKQANASNLPELKNLKLMQLERLNSEFTELQGRIHELQDRKGVREADLASLSPNSGIYSEDGTRLYSPEEQLLLLRAQYATKASRYSPDYPDLVMLTSEIQGLEAYIKNQQGAGSPTDAKQLTTTEWETLARATPATQATPNARKVHTIKKGENLSSVAKQNKMSVRELAKLNNIPLSATLRVGRTLIVSKDDNNAPVTGTYTDAYPDVKRVTQKLASENDSAVQSSKPPTPTLAPKLDTASVSRTLGDNPNYLRVRAEVDSINRELSQSRNRETELRTIIAQYEEDLNQTPEAEYQINELQRKLDVATAQLSRIKDKQLDAELATAIKSSDAGGRFALAEPISVPNKPDKPNRSVMMLLSLLLALAGSAGIVLLTELRRVIIYDARSLQSAMGIRPLVVIPQMTSNDKRLGWRRQLALESEGAV